VAALDRILIWNQSHLLYALREYERHHNTHRPHRGIANARPYEHYPTRPPNQQHSLADMPADTTDSADSSTNTSMPPDQHG
jgi:hypothetical protein